MVSPMLTIIFAFRVDCSIYLHVLQVWAFRCGNVQNDIEWTGL